MSINTTLASVNGSSASSQVSKSNGSENTKKTSEKSFKDEMQKVNEPEKETKKEEVAKTGEKTEVKEEETVSQTKENTKQNTVENKPEITEDKKPEVTDKKDQPIKHGQKDKPDALSKDAELKNIELLKNQQHAEMLKKQHLLDKNNIAAAEENQQQIELIKNQQLLDKNNNLAFEEAQLQAEIMKNQLHLDKNKVSIHDEGKQNAEMIKNQQQMNLQNMITENELNIQNINDKSLNKTTHTEQKHKHNVHKDNSADELETAQNIAMIQQEIQQENNYNADNLKKEENVTLNGKVLFNNTLTNFDLNNNELSNDIQQMINTSAVKTAAIESTPSYGTMKLNSANKVSMTQSDAEFFVNLTQNNTDISIENITAQAAEMTKQGADAKKVEKNVQVSQTLLEALSESRENNQPLRIDFDQNVSVVLRVNKDGVLAANFIPHDKAVEQYLRNNIEALKTTFNENDLPYSDLSYSNRGSKQQKEQQRNRQQQ